MTPPTAAASGTFQLGGETLVHRLGFGAMRLTGKGIFGPPSDRAEAIATLRRCLELGVNLIDTAESYGPFVSEELIAEALFPYPAGLVIATKGGLDRPGPDRWDTNGRVERLTAALHGSLRRLKLERIDVYQLHRIDPAVPEEEQFEFLQRVQREGKIRHVGLSEVSVAQIQRARKWFQVASVQNRYNLVDREGIGFIPWFPLQAGEVGRGGPGYYPRLVRRFVNRNHSLAQIGKRHGATAAQVALAWLLRRSAVVLPIPGTSNRRHLEENVAAAGIELSSEEVDALSKKPDLP
jgi:aryl-alcohol dehydrogenase-like predicted oxidoreductase